MVYGMPQTLELPLGVHPDEAFVAVAGVTVVVAVIIAAVPASRDMLSSPATMHAAELRATVANSSNAKCCRSPHEMG